MQDKVKKLRRKSTIIRNLTMIDKIPVSSTRGVTTSEIYEMLKDEDYMISKRTVQRDLEKLSELASLTYENDEQGHRRWFRDLRRQDVMDVVPTTEAFLLVLSEKLIRKTVPTNLSKKLEELLNKANAMLSSKKKLSKWKSKINVVSDSYPLIYDEKHIDEDYRALIYDCVLNEEKIKITYQSDKSDLVKDYILNPLGVIIRDQSHYLVATKEDSPEKPKLFLFHRISFAYKVYLDITKPKTFTTEEYFAKNPTGWLLPGYPEPEEVILRVKNYALDVVKHNKMAQDQVLEQVDETWWRITFTCYPTYDLISWILKFGQDVVCDSPCKITELVVNRLSSSLSNYKWREND